MHTCVGSFCCCWMSVYITIHICVLFLLLLDVGINNGAYLPVSVMVILTGVSLDNMRVLLFCWMSV